MKTPYRVIWFDDECKTLTRIIEQAHLNGIKLEGFTNAEEGIIKLRSDIKRYDAALLDGLFYKIPQESGTPTKDNALGDVFKELLRLERTKILPRFILSGQDSFTKEKNRFAESFKDGEVFDKSGDVEHLNLLWTKIKNEADKQPETRARQEFQKAFVPFELGIIDRKYEYLLLDIILCDYKGDYKKKNINTQRDLLEAIWLSLHVNIPIIPESFFDSRLNNKPNHESCALFFENRQVRNTTGEYKIRYAVPRGIGSSFRGLKESVNELSHLSEDEIYKFPYRKNMYLLMDVLLWLPVYTKSYYQNYI